MFKPRLSGEFAPPLAPCDTPRIELQLLQMDFGAPNGGRAMPTLIIDNVPISLFDQILDLAKTQRRTPADTALEVLAGAFRAPRPRIAESPLLDRRNRRAL